MSRGWNGLLSITWLLIGSVSIRDLAFSFLLEEIKCSESELDRSFSPVNSRETASKNDLGVSEKFNWCSPVDFSDSSRKAMLLNKKVDGSFPSLVVSSRRPKSPEGRSSCFGSRKTAISDKQTGCTSSFQVTSSWRRTRAISSPCSIDTKDGWTITCSMETLGDCVVLMNLAISPTSTRIWDGNLLKCQYNYLNLINGIKICLLLVSEAMSCSKNPSFV